MSEHEHQWIYSDDGRLFAKHCQSCNRAEAVSPQELAQMVRDLQQDFAEVKAHGMQREQRLAEATATIESYRVTNQRQLDEINRLSAELHDAPAKVAVFYEAQQAEARALLEALDTCDFTDDADIYRVVVQARAFLGK